MSVAEIIGIIVAFFVGCACVMLIVYGVVLRLNQRYDTLHAEFSDAMINTQSSIDALEIEASPQSIKQNKLWENFTDTFNVDLNKPLEDATIGQDLAGNDLMLKAFTIVDNKNNANVSACLVLNDAKAINTQALSDLLKIYQLVFLYQKKSFNAYLNQPTNINHKIIDKSLLDNENNLTKQAVQSVFPNASKIIQQDRPYLFKVITLNKQKEQVSRLIVDSLKWVFDVLLDHNNEVVFYWNEENTTLYRYTNSVSQLNDLSIYEK